MKYTAIVLSLTLILAAPLLNAQETKSADFDGNGTVDFTDFLAFAQGFGKSQARMISMKNSISTAMVQSIFRTFCFLSMPSASLQVRRRHRQNPSPGFFISAI